MGRTMSRMDEGHADRSNTVWLLLGTYLVVLFALTFLPLGGVNYPNASKINLDPFATIERALSLGPRSVSFRLLIGNIVAFLPLGLLLPLLSDRLRNIVAVFAVAAALSLTIEAGQYAISRAIDVAYRSADVDDVILNTTGAVLGFVVFSIARLMKPGERADNRS